MGNFMLSVPLPADFGWDEDWQSLAGALHDAVAGSAPSTFGVPEVDLGGGGRQVLRLNVQVRTRADAWLAARCLEDGLRDHGIEWAGASQMHGDDDSEDE